jgi:hypothetical protein
MRSGPRVSAQGQAVYEFQLSRGGGGLGVGGGWRRKTFAVGPRGLGRLVQAINDLGLFGLHRAYHADVHDGTQWCVLIKAGGRRKAVYCNNTFPPEVRQLAAFADSELIAHYADGVEAVVVPKEEVRQLDRALWAGMR